MYTLVAKLSDNIVMINLNIYTKHQIYQTRKEGIKIFFFLFGKLPGKQFYVSSEKMR